MNLGKISIILVGIFVVSTAIAIATGPVVLFNGFEPTSVYQTGNMSVQGISKLNIEVYDPDLTIHTVNGSEFQAVLSGTYAKNQYNYNMNLSLEKSGDVVLIKIIYPNNQIILINKNLKLDIGVPESYSGQLYVETTSGNVKAGDLKTEKLGVKSTSGDVKINNITVLGDSYMETTSGDINAMNIVSSNSEYKSTSGEITLTDSGEINSIKTTSGNIEVDGYLPKNDADFESTSGDISLYLKNSSSVRVEFHSISGDLKNSFGDILEGKYDINVRTTSGNLKVY